MKIFKKLLVILTTIGLVESYGSCNEDSSQISPQTEKDSQISNLQSNNLQVVDELDLVSIDKNTEKYTFAGQSLYDKDGNILYDRSKNKEDYTWYQKNYAIKDGKVVPQYNGRDVYVYEYWFWMDRQGTHQGDNRHLLANSINQNSSGAGTYGLYTLGIDNISEYCDNYYNVKSFDQESVAENIFEYELAPAKCWKKSEGNFRKVACNDNINRFLLKADNGEFIYMLKYDNEKNKNVFEIVCNGEACQIFQLCTFDENKSSKNALSPSAVKDVISFWKKSEYEKDPNNENNIIPKYTKSDGTCVDIYITKKVINVSPITNTISESKDAIMQVLGPQYKEGALETTVIKAISDNKDVIDSIDSKIGEVDTGSTLAGQISAINKAIGTLETEVTTDEGTKTVSENPLVTQISSINKAIGTVDAGSTLAGQISSINKVIGTLETEVTTEEGAEVISPKGILAKQISSIKSTVGTIGTAENPLTTQISVINKAIGAVDAGSTLAEQIKNINSTIGTLGTLKTEKEGIIEEVSESPLATQISNINSTIGTLGTKDGIAESPLTTQISSILQLVQEIKALVTPKSNDTNEKTEKETNDGTNEDKETNGGTNEDKGTSDDKETNGGTNEDKETSGETK